MRVRLARSADVQIVIDSDAHTPDGFNALLFGVAMARRGWLEASDVVNTLEWKDLRRKLKRHR